MTATAMRTGGKPGKTDTVQAVASPLHAGLPSRPVDPEGQPVKLAPKEVIVNAKDSQRHLEPLVEEAAATGQVSDGSLREHAVPVVKSLVDPQGYCKGGKAYEDGGLVAGDPDSTVAYGKPVRKFRDVSRKGYEGGGIIQGIKDIFTPSNVLETRRQNEQMRKGIYNTLTTESPSPQQPAGQSAPPAKPSEKPKGSAIDRATGYLGGRGEQIDREADKATGYAAGGILGDVSDWLGEATHGVVGTSPNVLETRRQNAAMEAGLNDEKPFDQGAFDSDLKRFREQSRDLGKAITSPSVISPEKAEAQAPDAAPQADVQEPEKPVRPFMDAARRGVYGKSTGVPVLNVNKPFEGKEGGAYEEEGLYAHNSQGFAKGGEVQGYAEGGGDFLEAGKPRIRAKGIDVTEQEAVPAGEPRIRAKGIDVTEQEAVPAGKPRIRAKGIDVTEQEAVPAGKPRLTTRGIGVEDIPSVPAGQPKVTDQFHTYEKVNPALPEKGLELEAKPQAFGNEIPFEVPKAKPTVSPLQADLLAKGSEIVPAGHPRSAERVRNLRGLHARELTPAGGSSYGTSARPHIEKIGGVRGLREKGIVPVEGTRRVEGEYIPKIETVGKRAGTELVATPRAPSATIPEGYADFFEEPSGASPENTPEWYADYLKERSKTSPQEGLGSAEEAFRRSKLPEGVESIEGPKPAEPVVGAYRQRKVAVEPAEGFKRPLPPTGTELVPTGEARTAERISDRPGRELVPVGAPEKDTGKYSKGPRGLYDVKARPMPGRVAAGWAALADPALALAETGIIAAGSANKNADTLSSAGKLQHMLHQGILSPAQVEAIAKNPEANSKTISDIYDRVTGAGKDREEATAQLNELLPPQSTETVRKRLAGAAGGTLAGLTPILSYVGRKTAENLVSPEAAEEAKRFGAIGRIGGAAGRTKQQIAEEAAKVAEPAVRQVAEVLGGEEGVKALGFDEKTPREPTKTQPSVTPEVAKPAEKPPVEKAATPQATETAEASREMSPAASAVPILSEEERGQPVPRLQGVAFGPGKENFIRAATPSIRPVRLRSEAEQAADESIRSGEGAERVLQGFREGRYKMKETPEDIERQRAAQAEADRVHGYFDQQIRERAERGQAADRARQDEALQDRIDILEYRQGHRPFYDVAGKRADREALKNLYAIQAGKQARDYTTGTNLDVARMQTEAGARSASAGRALATAKIGTEQERLAEQRRHNLAVEAAKTGQTGQDTEEGKIHLVEGSPARMIGGIWEHIPSREEIQAQIDKELPPLETGLLSLSTPQQVQAREAQRKARLEQVMKEINDREAARLGKAPTTPAGAAKPQFDKDTIQGLRQTGVLSKDQAAAYLVGELSDQQLMGILNAGSNK